MFLTRLGVPKLWRGDPEALWPHFLRPCVAPFVSRLSPAYGYGMDRVPAEGGGVIAANHLSGSDRLARPIAAHTPDLVLHGHGHAGRFEGFIGAVPVHNVSVPAIQRDFWIFELAGGREESGEGR